MDVDSQSIMLWGENGACGGHIKIHPRGSAQATVTEVSLTFIGLGNTDYWLGRVRQQLEELFQSEFNPTKSKSGE